MKRQIEILAPAGSYEGMKAAMNAGCDAVYIGGSSFGARAYANNLDVDTLLRAINEAHIRDKKLYLTVNTLLKEKEHTGELYSYLERYYRNGLDAVIVQDVGVLHFIHRNFPDLPIHASTQMTLTMAQGANLLKGYGVTRLVTSRELNLSEIKTISENTDLEIETFVHGALCYCYSGQCLMSSIIGGRSGNRGRCAQPCRMPYQFYSEGRKLSLEQEKFLLSPKDINTITIIPELVEAGIDSFKIEGRMKRPEYAAAVSSLYRKYLDVYLDQGKEQYIQLIQSSEFDQDMTLLQDVYNRGGFTEGYSKNYHGKKMMSLHRPNHSGVAVGEVKEITGSQVTIALKEQINAQDILEIRHKEEEGYEFTVKDPHNVGDLLRTNVGRRRDSSNLGTKSKEVRNTKFSDPMIHAGDLVYRTKNNELLRNLADQYMDKDKRLGIKGLLKAISGERLALTVSFGNCTVTAYQELVQEAQKQPMTKEKLLSPIEKTGDTLYYFDELKIEAGDHIFVPVAWLNEIRREAISLLQEAVSSRYRRSLDSSVQNTIENIAKKSVFDSDQKQNSGDVTFGICILVQTLEQFDAAISFEEITTIYAEYDAFSILEIHTMAKNAEEENIRFYLSLPHICRLTVFDRLKKDLLAIIESDRISGFVIKNFEEIALLQSLFIERQRKKELVLNYNMYVYNREAKTFWSEQEVTHFTAPVELNYQELKRLGIQDCDMLVYGYLPLMVSAQCLFESTVGCTKHKTLDKGKPGFSGKLTDRLGKDFFVSTNCEGCYNTIFNGQPTALHKQVEEITGLAPRNIRLDFSKETYEQTKQVIGVFINRFKYGNKKDEIADYTTGHFKRGVE